MLLFTPWPGAHSNSFMPPTVHESAKIFLFIGHPENQ